MFCQYAVQIAGANRPRPACDQLADSGLLVGHETSNRVAPYGSDVPNANTVVGAIR